ncbi:MAG: acyltransferase family protein [Mycobacterium sp.]
MRLLPPAALVITLTAVVAWFVAPLLSVFTAMFDLLWSIFYIGNWRFINQGNDYLAGTSDYNVALHFWSLAVEEQFYLVWPALLIAIVWVAKKFDWSVRRAVAVGIGAVSVLSFGVGLYLTSANPALAYMATYTRVWQFGAGALVAVLLSGGYRGKGAAVIGWLGLLAILYSIFVFDGSTAYPGWAALIPTFGATAIIACRSASLTWVLSTPVMRVLGRWSYPWYLWHWPVLVLADLHYGHLSWPIKLMLMVVALGLAGLTHHFVEVPLMRSPELRTRVPAAAAVGVIATVVATLAVLTVGTQSVHALGSNTGATTSVSFEDVFGQSTGANSGSVVPAPINARADIPQRPECLIDRTSVQPECLFGVLGGTPVVLFGDSHAHQWQTALDGIALQKGWELRVVAQSGCPVPEITPREGETARFSQDFCSTWRSQQIDSIVAKRPAIVFVSALNEYIPQTDEVLDAWSVSLTKLAASGAKLVYIRDTPWPARSIPECVSSATDDWSRCAFPASDAIDPVVTGTLQGTLPATTVIDLNGYLCDGDVCPAVRNGIMLYRDDSHLSNTAVKALTPALSTALTGEGI